MNYISGVSNFIDVTEKDSGVFRQLRLTDKANVNGELSPLNPQKDFETREKEIRKAAEGFEAIFTRQLLKIMRSSMIGESMFGEGTAGDIYGEILDGAIADKMASRGDLGIADMLYTNMLRKLEIEIKETNTEINKVK